MILAKIGNTFLHLCIINIEKCWRKINKEEFVEVFIVCLYIYLIIKRGVLGSH